MRLDPKSDVQVSRRSGTGTDLALAAEAQRDLFIDARRNGHLHLVPALDATLSVAARARLLHDAALASTRRARSHARDLAEDRLHVAPHLAGALARGALRNLRPRLRARPSALLALRGTGHVDRALGAKHRLREGDLDVHAQVAAALRPGAATAAACSAAEEHVEEIECGVEGERSEVGRHPVCGVAVGIVALPFAGVRSEER